MDLAIQPYGWMQLLAIASFLALTERRMRARGTSILARPWWIAAGVLAAGIGGRVHFAIEEIMNGMAPGGTVLDLLNPRQSGSTFFGAMAGVGILLAVARRSLPGRSAVLLLDDAVPGLATAIFIGRLGCLWQGCCLGIESGAPWALPARLDFLGDGIRYQPLALYLGLCALAGALLARTVRSHLEPTCGPDGRSPRGSGTEPGATHRGGIEILVFAAFFCAGRAVLESLRLQTDPGAIRWAQLESMVIAVLALTVLASGRRFQGRARTGVHEPPATLQRTARPRTP